ncbi:FUSC family protein [Streptomyces sp. NPDC051940]|uniref:FUSC family protein n=1 Tax=Streptomyces sp. NPDC051940 TaxID=3155675 RepID=UPI00343ECFC1
MNRNWFVPDPGRLRLRTAARAVVGIGLAVTATAAAGMPLAAVVTGGLAALLTLFVVQDPTVRRLAVTTGWLPAVALPVLAAATLLEHLPAVRDAAFLLVVLCGAYARRWGPRGHALGVFAFMMFFVMQFLQATPAELVGLAASVVLGVVVAAAVRFLLWPIERRDPPPAPVAPPAGRGLRRLTTRQALQVTAACAMAMAVGHALSDARWYWAVGTAWWIFVNTASRGETLVRGFRRVLGTFSGIAAGMAVALPLEGATAAGAAVIAVCVFGLFYTAPVSYSWMMFFVTVMVSILYGLIGVLTPALLALRAGQTAVGAVSAALAVAVILPVTTHALTDVWIRRAMDAVRACIDAAERHAHGDRHAEPHRHLAEYQALLARARMTLAPLLHPLNPFAARRARARLILGLLDECARELRSVCDDERIAARTRVAVEAALAALEPPLDSHPRAPFVPAA